MEKLTLDHFKHIVAEKYGYTSWEMLRFSHCMTFDKERIYSDEAAELYAEYSRSDQHKIAVDMTIDWCHDNYDTYLPYSIKGNILDGKTDKSLQYGTAGE